MSLIDYFQLASLCCASVWGVFFTAQSVARPSFNTTFGARLQQFDLTSWLQRWPDEFATLFDRVFGQRHLSWQRFYRSCLATTFALLVTLLAFLIVAGVSPSEYWANWKTSRYMVIWLVILPTVNFIPDYLSLIETRFLIGRLRSNPSLIRVVLFLCLDLGATATIFCIFYSLFYLLSSIPLSNLADYRWNDVVYAFRYTGSVLLKWSTSPELDINRVSRFETGIVYFTTFFTSVWLWLYVLAGIVAKILERILRYPWHWLKEGFLDLENKPLQSLGWVASGLVFIGFALASPLAVNW